MPGIFVGTYTSIRTGAWGQVETTANNYREAALSLKYKAVCKILGLNPNRDHEIPGYQFNKVWAEWKLEITPSEQTTASIQSAADAYRKQAKGESMNIDLTKYVTIAVPTQKPPKRGEYQSGVKYYSVRNAFQKVRVGDVVAWAQYPDVAFGKVVGKRSAVGMGVLEIEGGKEVASMDVAAIYRPKQGVAESKANRKFDQLDTWRTTILNSVEDVDFVSDEENNQEVAYSKESVIGVFDRDLKIGTFQENDETIADRSEWEKSLGQDEITMDVDSEDGGVEVVTAKDKNGNIIGTYTSVNGVGRGVKVQEDFGYNNEFSSYHEWLNAVKSSPLDIDVYAVSAADGQYVAKDVRNGEVYGRFDKTSGDGWLHSSAMKVQEEVLSESFQPEDGSIVRIVGHVQHEGELGVISSLAPSGQFANVDLYKGGSASFSVSDLQVVDQEWEEDPADNYREENAKTS